MTAALLLLAALTAPAESSPTLREVDGRLATIGWRLQTGNAALCRALQPAPGVQIHAVDQYPAALRAAWAQSGPPVQIEAVVAGSPAAVAGVAADDGLLAINGEPVPAPAPGSAGVSTTRDAANALIARQPADRPLALTLQRAGRPLTVTIPTSPGCRSAFEVLLGPGLKASSDGRIVQVSARFFETLSDDKIAAIVAHELSHTILNHRARLEAAGVKWGVLAEFGRNGRLFRRTEDDADRLSVHLLCNAGYDPQAAVRFWLEDGGKVDGGPFRGPSHGSAKARAAAIAAEIATLPPAGTSDIAPAVFATRDQPLS